MRPTRSEMIIDVVMGYLSARHKGVVMRQMNRAAMNQPSHCGDRIISCSGWPS